MALKISRPAESWTYVLAVDRALASEQQSRFLLKPLTQSERLAMRDEIAHTMVRADGGREIVTRHRRLAWDLALTQIVRVENFPVGSPIPWPEKGDREERQRYLEMLDDDAIIEIGDEVWSKSMAVGDDIKNS